MPLVLADRVRETTTTTGTGTISLAGPVSGFQGFSTAIGNANTTYYTIVDAATGAWEVGLGTYTSPGSTLARTTVLSSSNSDALVPFASGTKDVFVTQPAERAVYVLGAGTGLAAGAAAFTANGVPYASATNTLTTGSALTYSGGALLNTGSFAPTDGTNIGEIKINAATLDFNTSSSAVPQVFRLGSSEQMRLTSTGLGIGTSSPGQKLDVVGSGKATNAFAVGDSSGNLSGSMLNESDASKSITFNADPANVGASSFMRWNVDGTERMRLNSSGNLGIGTTNPLQKLVVSNSGAQGLEISPDAVASAPALVAYNRSGGGFVQLSALALRHVWQAGASPTEAMRLDSSGNLGIGTSSPSSFSGYTTVSVNNATNGGIYNILVNGTETARLQAYSGIFNVAAKGAATNLTFETNGTERMRLDSSGNLGLGVTPSAWTFATAAQVGYGAALSSRAAGSTASDMTHSAYWNGTNWVYQNSSVGAARYQMTGSNSGSTHAWFVSAGGTAGDPITFTQAMTLDASGLLTVGNTAPAGSSQITAYGASNGQLAVQNSTNWSRLLQNANNLYIDSGVGGSGGAIIFRNSSSTIELARIDSSGNLLVQSTSSSVTSGVGHKIRPDAAAPFMGTVGSSTSGADVTYSLYSTGAAAYRFYVGYNGTISATTTTISGISDQRLKENIRDLDDGLSAVMALKPRKFDWKAGKGKGIKDDRGFIAQEFEQVFPDMIDEWRDPAPEGEEPYKAVNANLIPTLVKALQELKAEFDAYKATHP